VGKEKIVNFHRWTLELPANQHSPLACQIGCPGWLVTQKSTGGSRFFSVPTPAYRMRAKYQKMGNAFFKEHLKSI